jgi:hypothetical protein
MLSKLKTWTLVGGILLGFLGAPMFEQVVGPTAAYAKGDDQGKEGKKKKKKKKKKGKKNKGKKAAAKNKKKKKKKDND